MSQENDGRCIPIEEFDTACREGKIADAEVQDLPSEHPYTNERKVRGTLAGEKVWSIKVYK